MNEFHFKRSDGSFFVILEYEPHFRTISFMGKLLRLKFPHMIFILNATEDSEFESLSLAFLDDKLTRDSEFYYPFLPNMTDGFDVCMGADFFDYIETKSYDNLNDLVKDVVDCFWNSSFNLEATENLKMYGIDDYIYTFFREWESTEKILIKSGLISSNKTLGQFIGNAEVLKATAQLQ